MSRVLPTLLLLGALGAPARAQSVEAETLFVEGEKLMAAGNYDKACDAFAASNRLEARAGTLINLGLCEEKRERYASAWIAFRESLTRVKDPVKKQVADERIAAIEEKLSYLTIGLADGAKVDGLVVSRDGQVVDPALYSRAIPVDGGSHVVEARAPGKQTWTKAVQVAAERARVTVDVPVLEVGSATTPAVPHTDAPGNKYTGRIVLFGVIGAAGLGTGIWGAVTARSADRDAQALCPDPEASCADAARANALLDRRDRRALIANIGFGVAAAGAIATIVTWIVGRPSPRADVAVIPAPDGANITVRIGF